MHADCDNLLGRVALKTLVERFWQQYSRLRHAVETNDALAVEALDRELDPILETIIHKETRNPDEIRIQFQFAIDLLNEEAEDFAGVQRNTELLKTLVNRYIGKGYSPNDKDGSNHTVLDEAWFDEQSDRIIVVSTDYRIFYCNAANASRYSVSVSDIIGKHIAEFVGLHRFQHGLKEKLVQCFQGEATQFTYAEDTDGRTIVVSLGITPCFSSSGTLLGAMIILEEAADRRRRSGAA